MLQRKILLTGIFLSGLAVATGAFGAHGLKELLGATGGEETYELAVRYQFYHALAILICGLLLGRFDSKWMSRAAVCFTLGIIFFSGSLYILSLTGLTFLGAVTPIGGLFFISGWIMLAVSLYKK